MAQHGVARARCVCTWHEELMLVRLSVEPRAEILELMDRAVPRGVAAVNEHVASRQLEPAVLHVRI